MALRKGVLESRKLLLDLSVAGAEFTALNAPYRLAPAKGPRGLRRAARKRRRKALATTLQRNAWRSYHELMKRVQT